MVTLSFKMKKLNGEETYYASGYNQGLRWITIKVLLLICGHGPFGWGRWGTPSFFGVYDNLLVYYSPSGVSCLPLHSLKVSRYFNLPCS